MRILKSFPIEDEKTKLASRVFDWVITRVDYPWRFDFLEMHIRDENKVELDEKKCIIILDYNDPFLQQGDEKGIGMLMMQLLFRVIMRERDRELPKIIEEVMANREIVRQGYGDDLAYFYYQKKFFMKREEKDEKSLEKHVAWLGFYRDDKYNSEFLRMKPNSPGVEKLLEKLKHDLDQKKNLENAVLEYEKLLKQE